jgi:uncharacterized peroxidase-related enzyme
MAHIPVPEGQPGIRGLMSFRPETALPLNQLVEVLLQGPSTLSKGERELIATYVSTLNRCRYCSSIHGAIAKAHLKDGEVVARVKKDPGAAPISEKLKALLKIAEKVQMGGRGVTGAEVAAARAEGATDVEIHDTVLIAAAFCMFNRYVDGLDTWAPDDPEIYDQMGAHRAEQGYLTPGKPLSVAPPSDH